MTTAELARAISMSASSTADRVRRLTDQGVIQGYRAVVDSVALGYPLTAFIRLRMTNPAGKVFLRPVERHSAGPGGALHHRRGLLPAEADRPVDA
ncbi:Lrp/AsnC family transcriptional regulator [Fodinicola feengrottensis]|uniref:Lrp/AsnC family transcriptional regulator n=1 Tax=Fodinicola feengrottensis TaxID=435914 RepID=UPI002441A835|nr:winged helix-turn-helix transcriptional regulator [Fodinicola feengrottensis]